MLQYIEYVLYRLKKTKIAFKQHRPINSKLYQPTFNQPKFHAITHFIQYIQDYGSGINYDTAYSEAAYKYFLQVFYNRTNKKEYDAQIRQNNVCYINIIAIKYVIILEKTRQKEEQLLIENVIKRAEVAKMLSLIDLDSKYMWAISNVDIDTTRNLGLTGVKKYWRRTSQIKEEVNGIYKDQISELAVFVKHSQRKHDNKKVTENMKIRRKIDLEQASSLFVQLYGSIHYWKMDSKGIVNVTKLVKKLVQCLLIWNTNGRSYQDHIWIGRGEPIDKPTNKKKP